MIRHFNISFIVTAAVRLSPELSTVIECKQTKDKYEVGSLIKRKHKSEVGDGWRSVLHYRKLTGN